MTQVGERSTQDQREGAEAADRRRRSTGAPVPREPRARPFLVTFWASAIAKKWAMALTGIDSTTPDM